MRLATATWTEVEKYLQTKNAIILPIGSTEQHGPTGLLGTDHLTAEALALEVGQRLGIAVAPALNYGMASHHMSFPGSATLSPRLYQELLAEVLKSFYHHGFRNFHVVNGHGGNENSARATFQQLKHEGLTGAAFSFYNWWKVPEVSALAQELYGEREGFHATPSEVSLTFFLHGIESRPYTYVPRDAEPARFMNNPWPLTADEMRAAFPDGVMRADPGLARREHGERFMKAAVDSISASIAKAAVLK